MVSITPVLKTGWNYGRRILNVTPDLILGLSGGGEATTQALSDAMLKGYRQGGLFNAARTGWNTLEGAVPKDISLGRRIYNGTVNGFKNIGEGFKNFGANYHTGKMEGVLNLAKKEGLTVAEAAEKISGGGKLWAGLKGGLKGFSKAMPFIGTALFVAFELSNIYTATKEQGLWQGTKEVVKAGTKLCGAATGAAAGAAIGSAICPGIGTAIGGLIGWLGGEKLASCITGKTYSKEKAENQEPLAQATQEVQNQVSQVQQATTANPYAASYNPAYGFTGNAAMEMALANKYKNDLFTPNFNVVG